jgi:hypothetical protein
LEDEIVDAEPGTADVVPAVDTASEDTTATDEAAAAAAAIDPAAEKEDADLDLEAEAARLQAEKLAADKAEAEKTDKVDADAAKADEVVDADAAPKPKTIAEATERLQVAENRVTQLTEMETKVLEIGGMPLIEMAQPLIDVISNPEATAGDILQKVADASGRDVQDMAWDLLSTEENQAAALAHFCGDDITPDILEKLVDRYQSGKITLEDADDEDPADGADEVFLSPKELKDRGRLKAADARDKAITAKEKETEKTNQEAKATRLEGERTAAHVSLGTLLETVTNSATEAFKADPADIKEVKELKENLNLAVRAITMLEMSRDPTFQRVQGLIKANGFKAADALAKGALSIKVSQRAATLVKAFNPLFSGGVVKLQKAAAKIATVRTEPSGARGAADIAVKRDTSVKNPNWRTDLDAETEAKIADLGKQQKRATTGQFA